MQHKAKLAQEQIVLDTLNIFTTAKTLVTTSGTMDQTVSGQQEISKIIPGIGVDDIVNSALFGGTMTLKLHAKVTAGYNLDKLGTGAIIPLKNRMVSLVLPKPDILDIQIDDQAILTGVLTQQDRDLQIRLKKEAQSLIRTQALSGDLLATAKSNTLQALEALFSGSNLTLQEVRIGE